MYDRSCVQIGDLYFIGITRTFQDTIRFYYLDSVTYISSILRLDQPWWLWRNLVLSDGESNATRRPSNRLRCIAPLSGYYTISPILATSCIVYYRVNTCHSWVRLSSDCVRNVVMYTHNQNDSCFTLFAGAPCTLSQFDQCLALCMHFSSRVSHCSAQLLHFIGCCTLPSMFNFEILSLISIESSLRIHCLLLHLSCNYRMLQVWNMLSNLHTL
jgi:hypothetical protein